jgi:hypothetical protein
MARTKNAGCDMRRLFGDKYVSGDIYLIITIHRLVTFRPQILSIAFSPIVVAETRQ